MTNWRELLFFGLITLCCASMDILSKNMVFAALPNLTDQWILIPGWFDFISRYNQGGMWSLGASLGVTANTWLASLSVLAIVVIVTMACQIIRRHYWGYAILFGMILGGALGNLYDRLVYGAVRDFIHVHYYDVYHYPTFNLADSFLVCGIVCILWLNFFTRDAAAPNQPDSFDSRSV